MSQYQNYLTRLKELEHHSACSASEFRKFAKICEKTEKKLSQTMSEYRRCRMETGRIRDLAELLLAHFTEDRSVDFPSLISQLKKYRGSFDHEFLIGSCNQDFHNTYDHMIPMLSAYAKTGEKRLMVQSEAENLLAPLEEALEKEEPDLFALTYFCMNHKEKELYELSAEQKRAMILATLQTELVRPFLNTVKEQGMDSPENYVQLEKLVVEMTGRKSYGGE